jgi:hypothetical protein
MRHCCCKGDAVFSLSSTTPAAAAAAYDDDDDDRAGRQANREIGKPTEQKEAGKEDKQGKRG